MNRSLWRVANPAVSTVLGAKNRVKLELLLNMPGLRVIFKEVGGRFGKTDRANRYV